MNIERIGNYRILWGIVIILVVTGIISGWYLTSKINIKSIHLFSPRNSALQEVVEVKLNKNAPVFITYWKKGSDNKFRTVNTKSAFTHSIHLLLLEPNTTYFYQVVIDRFINLKSKIFSFKTRKQSPWLLHDWISKSKPHNAKAIGQGLVMLCYGGIPGYISLIDGQGDIRWYWQIDTIGVRAATLTPQGTILALLHPPQADEINDVPDKAEVARLKNLDYPMRRGRIGYAGGTTVAEIDLTGQVLWKLHINKEKLGYLCIHHEIRMDNDHHILSFVRDPSPYDFSDGGGKKNDTLWGDAIVKLDTTGEVIWKWSPWKAWNFKQDTLLRKLAYDRFHFNALWITLDSNYLISTPIENQIWKINASTGNIMWKLGKGGDFKMDSSDYFHFQHNVNVLPSGDILIFDNGDKSPFNTVHNKYHFNRLFAPVDKGKVSRVLSFQLDTNTMAAKSKINISLPSSKYTSRMGSAYQLPNENFLVTSSKKGSVFVISKTGKILWELNSYFIPYRAEFIPNSVWARYFTLL